MIKKMTAREFAERVGVLDLEEIKYYGDAYEGAEDLEEDTELTIYIDEIDIPFYSMGYRLVVVRNDNPWNEDIIVIASKNINSWIEQDMWDWFPTFFFGLKKCFNI